MGVKTIFGNVFSKLFFLLFCTIIFVMILVILQTSKFYTTRLDNENTSTLYTYSNDLVERIDAMATVPALLAVDPLLLVNDRDNQLEILQRYYNASTGNLEHLCYLSLDSGVVISWPEHPHVSNPLSYIDTFGETGFDRDYAFTRIEDRYYVVVPVLEPETGDTTGFVMGALNYSDGLLLSSIQSYTNENTNVFVLDEQANMLAHSAQVHVGQTFDDLEVTLSNGYGSLSLQEVLAEKQPGITTLEYEFEGALRRGLFLYNPELDLYFGTSRIMVSIPEIINEIWGELGVVLLLVLALLILLTFILTNSIVVPVQKLKQHAIILAQNRYVPAFNGSGELQELRSLRFSIESIVKSLDAAHFSVIAALTKAMEEKDEYTNGHGERVTALALEIGKELKLSPQELLNLQYAAILHDIGKLAMPDSIMLKSKKLSSAEYSVICRHPEISEAIANKSEFLLNALPGIRHHHEWFNGTGYPDGLKGEEIPLIARIIAVADAFDAMTTTRPYRFAKSVSSAVAEIERCCGTQFDPQVVKAFLIVLRRNYYDDSQIASESR